MIGSRNGSGRFITHRVLNFVCHFNGLADKVKYRKVKAWNRVI
jgi:hypothetical protein